MRIVSGFVNTLALGLVAVLFAVVATVGSLLFLALGALLAWLTPLSLFQGICTAIGASVAMALVALCLLHGSRREEERSYWRENDDEDVAEDDADEDDAARPAIEVLPATPPDPKAGRNEPCPCGSGQKFKKCCGR
jgi:hypothetical protein